MSVSSTALQTALQHLATASKDANALIKPNITPEMQASILAINQQIFQAQTSSFAADQEYLAQQRRIGDLEKQIAEMKDRSKECRRYMPKQMDTGVTVYVLKTEEKAGTVTHEACPNCFSDDKVRILQPTHDAKYWSARETHYRVHVCVACNSNYEYGASSSRRAPVVRDHGGGDWRL